MADPNPSQQNGGLAYLTPECLDQLCDLIIAKLAVRNPWGLASQARRRGFESHHQVYPINLVSNSGTSDKISRLEHRHICG